MTKKKRPSEEDETQKVLEKNQELIDALKNLQERFGDMKAADVEKSMKTPNHGKSHKEQQLKKS